jgi:hypothetical protein
MSELSEKDIARFWSHVDRRDPGECWPWLTGKKHGYGAFAFGSRSDGTRATVPAHRVAYYLTHGRWPKPCCLHACDNPPCCNPAHLFEGTHEDNVADRQAKGRTNVRRGEAHPSTHLTERDIQDIRALSGVGLTQRELAERYGIRQPAMFDIIHRNTWANVPDYPKGERTMSLGENSTAAADFAQPICECGMLADECACTDDPASELNPAFAGLDFLEVDITTAPAWNAQLAAHAAAIVTSAELPTPEIPADVRAMVPVPKYVELTPEQHACVSHALAWIEETERIVKATVAGAALLAAFLLPGQASAREYPVIGTPAYDASCQIVTEWEDGGAKAYCAEDGETYLFDADGFFYNDHGIRFYGRAPGTWYVAPELLQIGPDAPVSAR